MATTLPLFWHLSSASKKERLDASVKLIGALEQFQSQFISKNVSGTTSGSDDEADEQEDKDDAAKSDGLDLLNAQDVSYSIRRLVRGLASPRESSRLGFAVALTELLSRIETVTCSQILVLLLDGTRTQGSMTGQEERDVLFARLFGLTAIVQSGLLVKTGSLATSASSAADVSTLSSYERTIKELLALGEKKSWLQESAWWTIALAIDALTGSKVTWKMEAFNVTLQLLFVENEHWSPEKVALAIKLRALQPNQDWRRLLPPSFKNPDILHTSNFQQIARILKELSTDEDETKDLPKTTTGNWKPQLHFVWDIILDQLLPGPNSFQSSRASFQDFFRIAVDESLFSSTASAERKYWGFQVFRKALPRVTKDTMPMLFTRNFMRTWINHLSHQDRYLHKIARQSAMDVQIFVQSNPQLGFALILQLTGANGNQQFDRLTKTKTVENILTTLDADGIKDYISYLLEQFNKPTTGQSIEDTQAINTRRFWIIEQLGALIRSGTIPKSDDWVQSVLDWLVVHGLFMIKKKSRKSLFLALHSVPSPILSDDLRQSCRNRLLNCIGDLNSQTTTVKFGEKSLKVAAVSSDGEFWASKVLQSIRTLEQDSKHVVLQNALDDDVSALCTKAQDMTLWLRTIVGEQQEAARGIELLLSATMLQQYCEDETNEVDTEALQACLDGAARMFPQGKKQKKSTVADNATVMLEPVDVFVDVIIGFLEKSTAFLRTVGNQVFGLLSGAVKESTIDLIISQLEHRDPAELRDDEDEEMGSIEDEDDGNDKESEESEESEADADSDDGGESDEEEDVELRSKIEEALRVNGIEAATGESDNEEELMDDDQMMAVDEQLAQVFRSQVNDKNTNKGVDAQREATHFKNRVLDLVDTFIKKHPSNRLVLRLISPLIDLISSSGPDERQLSDKAKGIVRSRIAKSKEVPDGAESDSTFLLLADLHTRARKAHSSDMMAIFSQCSIYLSKILLQLDSQQTLLEVYQQSLADFLTRKNSSLHTSFFLDFIRRFPSCGWTLRNNLLDLSAKAVNTYRQCQAYQLLEVLISQIPNMGVCNNVEIKQFMAVLQTGLLEVAIKSCDEDSYLNPTQLKDVFKLTLVAIRHTLRVDRASTSQVWHRDSWQSLAGRLDASERFKKSPGLQKMCEQIVRLLESVDAPPAQSKKGTSAGTKKITAKRKVEDGMEAEAISTVKKSQRKRLRIDKSDKS